VRTLKKLSNAKRGGINRGRFSGEKAKDKTVNKCYEKKQEIIDSFLHCPFYRVGSD
jgi:hypothetical protein